MSCACGGISRIFCVCFGGRAATVGILAVLQWLDGGERTRYINKNW